MTLISRFIATIKSDRCTRWAIALLLGLMVPLVQATQINETGLSNTTQRCEVCQRYEDQVSKLDSVAIRIDPGLDPAYAAMRKHRVMPLDLGYAYIGKVTLPEYQEAWERFFKARAAHLKLMGETITKPCNLLVTETGLTIHGPSCLPVAGFERVDAKFDEAGILSAILLVLDLEDDTILVQVIINFFTWRIITVTPFDHNRRLSYAKVQSNFDCRGKGVSHGAVQHWNALQQSL